MRQRRGKIVIPAKAGIQVRRGVTLLEMLFIMVLAGIMMVLFYTIFSGTSIRAIGLQKRADGQESVRILLARIRQELKSATGLVDIQGNGRILTIPLEDRARPEDDRRRFYFSQYEYNQRSKEIIYRKLDRQRGGPLEERLWLGGRTQVLNFLAFATSENERILFQYYRVVVEVDHYDVKLRPKKSEEELAIESGNLGESAEIDPRQVVHTVTSVYPRRVNMELRIEVPQEGGSL